MIYDCFSFFNEMDILEIRLNVLNPFVDKFILLENTITYSGKSKPFYYEDNKERFKEFHDKIIHIKATDVANDPKDRWVCENDQRNKIMELGLNNLDLHPDDIIFISDVDEIPNLKTNYKSLIEKEPHAFEQGFYYYKLNRFNPNNKWKGTVALQWKFMTTPQDFRDRVNSLPHISNGGWHFSFMGDAEHVKHKINSFAHDEFDNDNFTNVKELEKIMENGSDIFKRDNRKFDVVPMTYERYPKWLIENQYRYQELIAAVDTKIIKPDGYTLGNPDSYEPAFDKAKGAMYKQVGGAWFATYKEAEQAIVSGCLPDIWFPGKKIPARVYALYGGTHDDVKDEVGSYSLTSQAKLERIDVPVYGVI